MSFTDRVKAELTAEMPKLSCCRRALLYAILAMRGEITRTESIAVTLEGDLLFSLTQTLVFDCFHRECRRQKRAGAVAAEQLVFSSPAALTWLRSLESIHPDELFPVKCNDCRRYFLSGLFLAGGHASDPENDYRVEFSCGCRRAYVDAVLSSFGLSAKYADRRAERLLYFRDSTAIEEIFGHMGAVRAFFKLTDKKIEADFRNMANRRANCDANNIQRAVAGAAPLVALIERLQKADKLSALPPELEETARLRLENPTLSLTQLIAVSAIPMTKSGLNHRLSRLREIAEDILARTEEGGT